MPRDLSLCPGCFERKASEQGTCPRCGYDQDHERLPLSLPAGTELKGRYVAGRVLGDPGGFGITYLGFDRLQEERVAIKEYMPRELAGRDTDGRSVVPHSGKGDEEFEYGKDRFLGEARALAQFDHANIAKARDFFEANGTAYLVMDYYEGKTLKQYLSEQPDGRMNPEPAAEVMLRVLDGLQAVHAEEYLHRDIKPENIYLTKEGRPILIDFGAARQAMGERSQSLSVVMTEGYAPYEQYRRRGDQGPHTDVYGCGATLYRMVTGQTPEPASERIVDDRLEVPQNLNSEVPAALGEVIVEAMAVKGKERPQTAEVFQRQLRAVLRGPAPEEPGDVGRVDSESAASDGMPGQDIPEDGGLSREAEAPPEGKESAVKPAPGSTETNEGMLDGVNWAQGVIVLLVVAALGLGGAAVALYPSGKDGDTQATEQTASTNGSLNTNSPSKAEQFLKEARGYLENGRLVEPSGQNALSSVRQALEEKPESAEAQRLLGRIARRLEERGDAAREEDDLEAAVDLYEWSLEIESRPLVEEKLETVRKRADRQKEAERIVAQVRSTLNQTAPTAEELRQAADQARRAAELDAGRAEGLLGRIADRFEEQGDAARAEDDLKMAADFYESSLRIEDRQEIREKLEVVRGKIRKDRERRANLDIAVPERKPDCGGAKAIRDEAEYPSYAKENGIQGRVVVRFTVSKEGEVHNPQVVRGTYNNVLRSAASEAVREIDCKPKKEEGEKVESRKKVKFNFEKEK